MIADLITEALFPAPAGMNRAIMVVAASAFAVPRARGDEPIGDPELVDGEICSPRPRG